MIWYELVVCEGPELKAKAISHKTKYWTNKSQNSKPEEKHKEINRIPPKMNSVSFNGLEWCRARVGKNMSDKVKRVRLKFQFYLLCYPSLLNFLSLSFLLLVDAVGVLPWAFLSDWGIYLSFTCRLGDWQLSAVNRSTKLLVDALPRDAWDIMFPTYPQGIANDWLL